jgi:HD-GYP domain-containing protein (c-di-GMP phosphodiesterase class II)
LKGEEIPIEARILSVADAYEALTSERPYRRAYSPEEAVLELRSRSGTQFDPKILDQFIHMIESHSHDPQLEDRISHSFPIEGSLNPVN